MQTLFLTIFLSIIGRAQGAAWNKLPIWTEAICAFTISLVLYHHTHSPVWMLIGMGFTYFAIQTGHGRFYEMKGANLKDTNPEHLEYLVQLFYRGNIEKPLYSWICMGLKGFFIGLAAFPMGLLVTFTHPLGYWLGFQVFKKDAWAEYIAWGFVGAIISLSL